MALVPNVQTTVILLLKFKIQIAFVFFFFSNLFLGIQITYQLMIKLYSVMVQNKCVHFIVEDRTGIAVTFYVLVSGVQSSLQKESLCWPPCLSGNQSGGITWDIVLWLIAKGCCNARKIVIIKVASGQC